MDTHLDICDGLHASFASKNKYEMYVLANILKKTYLETSERRSASVWSSIEYL